MSIHEWCIAVLKGKKYNIRFAELYSLCTKYYSESVFNTEEELRSALEPFNDYFLFEEYMYDYVTFVDDGQIDMPILEQAKDVLRSHDNRYTLEVLCRRINAQNLGTDEVDDATLKNMLTERKCFTLESRSITLFKLSSKGLACDVEPMKFTRGKETKNEKLPSEGKKVLALDIKLEELTLSQLRQLKRAVLAEEQKRKNNVKDPKLVEERENDRINKLKRIIEFYEISDYTTIEQLWLKKLISKKEYTKCLGWKLSSVGDVYNWVTSHSMPINKEKYHKHTVNRMMKIASFHDPELARLIPDVKFCGIRKTLL
ncbi:hypothetical protein [Xylanibacter ruminicola]|uniref:hypothetical protein n=1 Tax=Xylanibacter ruminicola TaxID=839 RepID=UPI00048EE370|nr:hypothetical protein [Xylanibacter ruminicola]